MTVTDNAATAPDGTSTAATVVAMTTGDYVAQYGYYSGFPYKLPAGTYMPSFWLYPVSTSGTLNIGTNHAGTSGQWTINLAQLPQSTWTRIAPGVTGVTVVYPFTSVGNDVSDGIFISVTAGAPVSFNIWGAQINRGTVPLGYQVTTTSQFLPGVIANVGDTDPAVAFADPSHTHANGAAQTSGAGTSHTHTFTGCGVPDPPNEVFLPYFRR
jgi:hypothetical protein